jgi:hypothetical protein
LQASGRDGLKGTEVIRALQAKRAWTALFWAPDPRHPADGDSEHPSAYRNVRVNGTYSGITVDPARSVINYRPKKTNSPPDLTGIERLRRLPCGLLGARGGTHMALIINGDVHEVHFQTRLPPATRSPPPRWSSSPGSAASLRPRPATWTGPGKRREGNPSYPPLPVLNA